jgi:hypothetical protein
VEERRREAHARTKTRVAAGDMAVAIRLAPGVRIQGVVTCRKEPVVGASVAAKGASVETGAGGRFALDAVPLDANIVMRSRPASRRPTSSSTWSPRAARRVTWRPWRAAPSRARAWCRSPGATRS